jgi:chromate transporter
MAVVATAFYEAWSHNHTAQIALHGALAAAVAVMVITGVTIIRPHWRNASAVKLFAFVGGAFSASVFFSVSPIQILFAAAVLGCLWPAAEKRA